MNEPLPTSTGVSPASSPRDADDLSRLLVLMDYDGTITTRDCNEVVLQNYTGDAWRDLWEARVDSGEIGHAECFRGQMGLIRAPRAEVIAAMAAAAEPAAGVAEFLAAIQARGARIAVVSVGIAEAIASAWKRLGLPPVELHASELLGDEASGYDARFDPVFGECPRCGPGGCKSGAVRELAEIGDAVAMFGDGVSDLCLAREADIVFAKGSLARLCVTEGIRFRPLDDYHTALRDLLAWAATA